MEADILKIIESGRHVLIIEKQFNTEIEGGVEEIVWNYYPDHEYFEKGQRGFTVSSREAVKYFAQRKLEQRHLVIDIQEIIEANDRTQLIERQYLESFIGDAKKIETNVFTWNFYPQIQCFERGDLAIQINSGLAPDYFKDRDLEPFYFSNGDLEEKIYQWKKSLTANSKCVIADFSGKPMEQWFSGTIVGIEVSDFGFPKNISVEIDNSLETACRHINWLLPPRGWKYYSMEYRPIYEALIAPE